MKTPTSFKKLGMFTDIHFGRRSNSRVHNQDCLDFISWFCANVKADGNYTHIGFLGDWFESRSAINIDTMEYSYKGLQMLNELGIPVYFVVGNHDLHRRTTREVHSVRMFQELENFVVISQPTLIDSILFSPYLFDDEYPSLLQYNDAYAWAGHFEFKGFVLTGANNVAEHGPDHTLFSGPKQIFSGHFHKRQANGNVKYIGNCYPMDFGDAGDHERGMCTYHVLENKVEYKDWPDCPTYLKLPLSKILEDRWKPRPKMRVKCIIDSEIGYQEAQDLRESMITEYNLRDFILEEDRATKQGLLEGDNFKVEESLLDFTGIDDLVVKQLEAAKADKAVKVDVDTLIEIYKSLEIEALAVEE